MNLRPYQEIAVRHILANERCNLWAGMGLGKTVSVLTALDYLYRFGFESHPTLVLAPKRVARSVWPAEARKWPHLGIDVVPIVGTAKERAAALKRDAAVYAINYDNLPWLVHMLGKRWPYGTGVADEATRLKGHRLNSGGIRAHALSKVAHLKQMHRWINLTGTPSPNGLIDLWGQQWFIDGGKRLGLTFTGFKERWFYPSPNGYGLIPQSFAQEQIQARLSDCTLTIDSKDWFDLQEPIVNNIYVDLPTDAMRLYKQMERDMYIELEHAAVEAFNSASMTIKCLQLACGAIYLPDGGYAEVHDAKLEALDDIVEESAGAPLIVVYQWRHDLAQILKRYQAARQLQTPQDEVDWNEGKIPMLVLHPESAGHGLNLQDGGNTIVFFGHWWSLEPYQQVIERIGPVRQMQSGHNRNVFIHHILARNTIDRDVMLRRETKASVQELLLASMRKAA